MPYVTYAGIFPSPFGNSISPDTPIYITPKAEQRRGTYDAWTYFTNVIATEAFPDYGVGVDPATVSIKETIVKGESNCSIEVHGNALIMYKDSSMNTCAYSICSIDGKIIDSGEFSKVFHTVNLPGGTYAIRLADSSWKIIK